MQEAARRYAEDARRRAGVPIHIRVGVNSGEVVVRSIGGDLKMDYTAVRRDCPRRLMSSSAGVADALEDLSGRGASGRPVSFTTVSPGSRACSVRGPSEDRREHRKDSSLLMRSSSQNRQARTADGRCQEPGGARVRARGALRLSALADAPMAFGSTLAREEAFPKQVWQERAERGASRADRVTFIAERDGEWIGLSGGLAKDPDDPNDPRPVLVGMFVAPTARGRGVGVALVDAVIAWAWERRAIGLCLWVTATNSPAIALYNKCGFRRTGETKPLAHAHSPSIAEFRMVLDLD